MVVSQGVTVAYDHEVWMSCGRWSFVKSLGCAKLEVDGRSYHVYTKRSFVAESALTAAAVSVVERSLSRLEDGQGDVLSADLVSLLTAGFCCLEGAECLCERRGVCEACVAFSLSKDCDSWFKLRRVPSAGMRDSGGSSIGYAHDVSLSRTGCVDL